MTAVERHAAKVARIVAQLKAHRGDKPLSLRKKAVAHQVPKAKDLRYRDDKIDISDLTEILEVDPVKQICVAESGVTFVDLVRATLAHGLVPIVVPELKTITIGGAVAGCSIESMSFVHGGFHDTCLEYEVIAATGDVLTCTPDNQHKLVFQMVHGGFGTLGILAKLVFKLVPAKRYVHVVYEKHTTIESYQASIARHTETRDVEFMDGIIHSPSLYVLSVGHFVDRAPYTNRYDRFKVYYKSTATRDEDYLETPQYFFRYDRGVTNVRLPLLSSTHLLKIAANLHWLLRSEKPTITLDVFVPFSKVPEFLTWYEHEFGFFPLWCVPYRRVHDYEWLADDYWRGLKDGMFLDLAIYGMKQKGDKNYHRIMEEKLRELGGIKTLIAHNYYPEAEFWTIFNKRNYDAVKQITDPKHLFRDLYTKTCKAVMGRA
ncbi:MAG TPA: FAD-binding oxidoreductase [Kofleriaceae bacterium]|nr:FAD-binding oxidoreductase [Kofleriaceae bacterium]